jgi:EpsI family protein
MRPYPMLDRPQMLDRQPLPDRRTLLVGGAMIAAGATIAAAQARMPAPPRLHRSLWDMAPSAAGPWQRWTEPDALLPAIAKQHRFFDSAITLDYRGAGVPPVTLTLAYGADQHVATRLHRPERCLRAAEYAVSEIGEAALPLGTGVLPLRTLTAALDSERWRMAYWRRLGRAFPANSAADWREFLTAAAGGYGVDGMLVLFSVPEEPDAEAHLIAFARALILASDAPLRLLLLGPLSVGLRS